MVLNLLLLVVAVAMSAAVRGDYPPPSEDRHGYYTRRSVGGGGGGSSFPGLVGTGRVTSGFGGESYGGPGSDYRSVGGLAGSDWVGAGDAGMMGLNAAKCVDIPSNLSLCANIGYDKMRLPNLLEHDTLKEVGQQASSWVRLLHARCHQDTQVFLCSLFAPVCLDRPVWPCRSLCEAVKNGCEHTMLKYGFPWPDMLRCDQYPSDNDLCIGLRNVGTNGDDSTACSACSQTSSVQNIVDRFCAADFAMRIKVDQSIVTGSDLKIVPGKKRKVLKLKSRDMKSAPMFIENGANCNCAKLENTQQLDGPSAGQQQRGGKKARREASNFLVVGRKAGDRLVVDMLQAIEKSNKDVNKALKAIRQPDACRAAQLQAAAGSTPTPADRQRGGRRGGGGGPRRVTTKKGHRSGMVTEEIELTTTPATTTVTTTTVATTTTAMPTTIATTLAPSRPASEGGRNRNQGGGNRRRPSGNEGRRNRPQKQGGTGSASSSAATV